MRRLDALGVLSALEPAWHMSSAAPEFGRLEEALSWAQGEPAIHAHLSESAHQRLLLIFAHLPAENAARLAARLRLRKKETAQARLAPAVLALLPRLERPLRPSELDALLRALGIPLILMLMALSGSDCVWEQVKTYVLHWRVLPPLITGHDLRQLGIPRGIAVGRIMRSLRVAQLDGLIHTREEALAMAQRLENENSEQ